MRSTADLATLARLHGALDSVVETEHAIAAIREGWTAPQPGVARVGELLAEARELLRTLLTPSPQRHLGSQVGGALVGPTDARRNSGSY